MSLAVSPILFYTLESSFYFGTSFFGYFFYFFYFLTLGFFLPSNLSLFLIIHANQPTPTRHKAPITQAILIVTGSKVVLTKSGEFSYISYSISSNTP